MSMIIDPYRFAAPGGGGVAAEYWRMYITNGGPEGIPALREIEFAPIYEAMPARTPLSSAVYSGPLSNAFDGNWSTNVHLGIHAAPWYIGCSFATPIALGSVRWFDNDGNRYPKSFKIQHSNDGSAWTDVPGWEKTDRPWNSGKEFMTNPALPNSMCRLIAPGYGDFSAIAKVALRQSSGGADYGSRAEYGWGYDSSHPWMVFDGNPGTFWYMYVGTAGGFMIWEPAAPWDTFTHFALQVSAGDLRMMTSFQLQTSSDGGATWDDKLVVPSTGAWSSNETKEWAIP